jgi:hypothetical protein
MRPCDLHVIEMDYEDTHPEFSSTCGGMDSEPTGRTLTTKRTWRVVVPSLALAQELWRTTRGHVPTWKVIEWRDLGTLDALMLVEGF